MVIDKRCVLCEILDENIEYIFFYCFILKNIWLEILNWIYVNYKVSRWIEEI